MNKTMIDPSLLQDIIQNSDKLDEIVDKTRLSSGAPSGKLSVEVLDDDHPIIKALKEEINAAEIDMKFIAEKLDCTQRDAYNLFYGISKKSRISIASLEKWCIVLGKEMVVSFE